MTQKGYTSISMHRDRLNGLRFRAWQINPSKPGSASKLLDDILESHEIKLISDAEFKKLTKEVK